MPFSVRASNHGRPAFRRARLVVTRRATLRRLWPSTMTVCHPNAFHRAADRLHVVAELCRHALSEPVDVDDPAQVIEFVIDGRVGRFPDRPFRHLAVAEEHIGAVVGTDPARVQRGADRGADALTERPGRDIDERQSRRRMPFEIRADLTKLQQLFAREQSRFRPRGIQNRRGVSLRQHEPVVVRILRILRVESHLAKEQRRDDLRRRHAGRRMAAPRFRGGADRVDAKLGREVLECGQ